MVLTKIASASELDNYIQPVMDEFDIPGLAVAITRGGKIV